MGITPIEANILKPNERRPDQILNEISTINTTKPFPHCRSFSASTICDNPTETDQLLNDFLSIESRKDQLQRIENLENKILMLETIILKSKNHTQFLPKPTLFDQIVETNKTTESVVNLLNNELA
jgi:hypothetical protein